MLGGPTPSQRGDTIIEVMVALAVLGLALSISYATAHRSLLNIRQAQENSIASSLVQSQVEAVRVLSNAGPPGSNNLYNPGASFCMYNGAYEPLPSPNCTFDSLYQIEITHPNGDKNSFMVTAQWPDVLNEGTDVVTMNYKLYQ